MKTVNNKPAEPKGAPQTLWSSATGRWTETSSWTVMSMVPPPQSTTIYRVPTSTYSTSPQTVVCRDVSSIGRRTVCAITVCILYLLRLVHLPNELIHHTRHIMFATSTLPWGPPCPQRRTIQSNFICDTNQVRPSKTTLAFRSTNTSNTWIAPTRLLCPFNILTVSALLL